MPRSRQRWTSGIVRARAVERHFGRQLRKIARHVADIVRAFEPGDPDALSPLQSALSQYADAITPWAEAAVHAMHVQVNARDLAAWQELSQEMKRALMAEIRRAPTGNDMRRLMGEQVSLIRSLPLEAAQRVHDWTIAGIIDGTRAAETAAAIRDTFGVTAARARMIARTETSRTAATLQQARAEYVGARNYIWRTSEDSDVRPSHRALNGTVHDWNNPPLCDPPHYRAHPGCIFYCRCWSEPIIPDIS